METMLSHACCCTRGPHSSERRKENFPQVVHKAVRIRKANRSAPNTATASDNGASLASLNAVARPAPLAGRGQTTNQGV